MEQDGNSPVLFWTTSLVGTGHEDGSVSLWVVEESAFGRVTHKVATRVATAAELIPALVSLSDWSDLEIGYEEIIGTVVSRLATVQADLADAVESEAALLLLTAQLYREAA
jgi:hypothetical protein